MSHQPFETWNLDRSNLTPEERGDLERHVASCPVCQQTRMNWEHAKLEFRNSVQRDAPSGFTARFQNSLAERRRLAHSRQVRRILTILCLSLAGIGLIIAIYILANTPPVEWIGNLIQSFSDVTLDLRRVFYIVTFWASRIPPLALIAAGVIPFTWAMVLVITGAFTYSRFHPQGETQK